MSECARCGYPIEMTNRFVVLDDEVYCMGCYELVSQLLEENEQLKKLIHIADGLIEWNTIPQVRREWEKQKKVMWND